MTDQEEKRPIDPHAGRTDLWRPSSLPEDRPYRYRHAGIEEREGRIPLWLTLVVAGLLFWSVYYTIQFWSPG
jgi:hypothetical protein